MISLTNAVGNHLNSKTKEKRDVSESDPKPSQPSLARDAIIFIPAIDTTWTDQSIELISQKLVTALDRNAKTPEARFKSEVRYEDYGANTKKRVCTIKRTDDGNDIQVLDIYDMGYSQLLRKPFENRSLFVKALLVFLAIIKSVPLLITAFRKKSKTVREKMQLGFAALILGLLGAYMFLLLVAAGGVVIQGMRGWK